MLSEKFLSVIRRYGYERLNDLQERAIAAIKHGAHTLIVAPTGSGKTEAALFPVLDSLVGQQTSGIKALYVTPLRALNRDIFRRFSQIAADLGIKLEIRHGDTPQSVRRKMAINPPHVLITTPETLQFILVGKRLRSSLRGLKWVIVDELHEFIDSKRGAQLTLALERLEIAAGSRVQRIGLSATISDPSYAAAFLTGGRYCEIIELGAKKRYEIDVVWPPGDDMVSSHAARIKALEDLLARARTSLIFTNTRDTAEVLAKCLRATLGEGIEIHHGSLSKEQRLRVETLLRHGELRAVVSTSSLELGIDVGHIDRVVQYASPRQAIRLVQRIGRAGHKLSLTSKGSIIALDLDDYLESLVLARRARHGDLEELEAEERPYDALAHQLVGLALDFHLDGRELTLARAHSILSRAYPYRNLLFRELKWIAEFLENLGILRVKGEVLRLGRRCFEYYFESASMIPELTSLPVIDISSRRHIANVDADFAAALLEEGVLVVLAGRLWKVVSLDLEEGKVLVKPATAKEGGEPPVWVGEDLPVPFKVAREVGALRRRLANAAENGRELSKLIEEYDASKEDLKRVLEILRRQLADAGCVPSDREVLIEAGKRTIVIHACLGTKGCETLGLLLSKALADISGQRVSFRSDPYRVIILGRINLSKAEWEELLREKLASYVEVLPEIVRQSNFYKWKFLHVAQRLGIVKRGSRARIPANVVKLLRDTPADLETVKECMYSRLDLEAVRWLIENLKWGRISVRFKRVLNEEFSPLSSLGLLRCYKTGIVIDAAQVKQVLERIRARLEKTTLRLICLHCGSWYIDLPVKSISPSIRCSLCGSRALAISSPQDEVVEVVRKWRRGAKLTKREKEIIRRLQQSAVLFLSYGRLAALALAGRGVGPSTATKILGHVRNEEELVSKVAEAESEFARTSRFWRGNR